MLKSEDLSAGKETDTRTIMRCQLIQIGISLRWFLIVCSRRSIENYLKPGFGFVPGLKGGILGGKSVFCF